MYAPAHFEMHDVNEMHEAMRACGLAHLVTNGAGGLVATPLPLFVDSTEGEFGTIYGHLARANEQWKTVSEGEALAIFAGPDAYISPSWYITKEESGKVVPTWNYRVIHAYGEPEFFHGPDRLMEVVTRLTQIHEGKRSEPWQVTDAPADFLQAQLRGIVGLRMPITRLEGKLKMSQNRTEADRNGVVEGLLDSQRPGEHLAARLIPLKS